jgi:prepilin-type N-terminal cleavage/methylation domain-containing protein
MLSRPHPNRRPQAGVTLIEVLVVVAIAMIVASLVLRVVYPHRFHDWEDGLWRSVGINPGIGRLATALTFLVLLGIRTAFRLKRRSQRLKANHGSERGG